MTLPHSREQLAAALAATRERAKSGLDAAARERGSDVVRWRREPRHARAHSPEPWAGARYDDEPPEPAPDQAAQRVGFDGDGRVAIVEYERRRSTKAVEAWLHGDGWSEQVEQDSVMRFLRDADGQVAAAAGIAYDGPRIDRWSWDDGVAREHHGAWLGDDHVTVSAHVAEVDDAGRLVALREAIETVEREHDDELDALFAGLDRAAALVPAELAFDARVHRPEPRLRDVEALVELLAPEIERAVVAAVADSGVPRPFAIELRPGRDHFVPFVRVGGAAFRDRVRAVVPDRHAALKLLEKATPPDGATVSLLGLLSDEALRACRELDWALGDDELDRRYVARGLPWRARDAAHARASAALEALGAELSARLNGYTPPGATGPFLALVFLGALDQPLRPFVRAAETVGTAYVQDFRDSIAAQPREPVAAPAAAREDRDALEAWLADCGLAAEAPRIAHQVARVGLRLDAAGGRDVRSRLGGPGLLAPGAAWPHAEGDRPHTFMAGIDLAELPATEPLPPAGWLLFYADIDDPHGQAAGLVDVSDNAPGAQIHVAYLEPGVEPVEVAPPAGLSTVLNRRPVVAVPRLTLPTSWEAAGRLGLRAAEGAAYDDASERLGAPDFGRHWVLGWETGVQGYLPDDDSVLLLHLAWDDALGFQFLDGGALQFSIPRASLAARDWSAVEAHADSG